MLPGALQGFRIIDLSTQVPGAFCSKLFADYGADVIKVEPLSGDPTRNTGPFSHDEPHPEKSLLFFYLNCNKRGITLNLESPAGRKLFRQLLEHVDAVIESYPPGYLANLGLSYDQLFGLNPRLVMTSITPFGQTGPYRDYAGDDLAYYAMSGIMYTSGAYDREPLKHGHPQTLYMGGINAAYATSAALFARTLTGRGQHIDLSLAEVAAAHHAMYTTRYSYAGVIERRAPKVEPGSVKGTGLQGIVRAKDGHIGATPRAPGGGGRGSQRRESSIEQYVKLIGRPDLVDQVEQAKTPTEIDELILPILQEWDKHEYFHTVMADGGSAAMVQTGEDLENCPQLKERRYFSEIEHPIMGELKMPGEVFRLEKTPWKLRYPAPLLGQHNESIYGDELGYTKQQLVLLRQQGVV